MTKPPNARVPFDSSNSKVICTTLEFRFLPHTVPSPGCLFITPLATPALIQRLCTIPRVRLIRVGPPPPF